MIVPPPTKRVVPYGAMIVPRNLKGRTPRSFFILDILPIWCHDSSPPNLMGRIPFIKDLRGTGDAFLGAQMIRNQVKV